MGKGAAFILPCPRAGAGTKEVVGAQGRLYDFSMISRALERTGCYGPLG